MTAAQVLPLTITVSIRAEGKEQAAQSMVLEVADYDGKPFDYQCLADTAIMTIQQSIREAAEEEKNETSEN